jgi:hypothetical protein
MIFLQSKTECEKCLRYLDDCICKSKSSKDVPNRLCKSVKQDKADGKLNTLNLQRNKDISASHSVPLIITFKSLPEFYKDEEADIKNWTIRDISDWTLERWEAYRKATHVKIRLKDNGRTNFTREILRKYEWRNFVAITWRQR